MRNIYLVLSREVSVRVRRKAFLLTTFLTPLVFILVLIVPSIIMNMDTEEEYHVGVFDSTGRLFVRLKTNDKLIFNRLAAEEDPGEILNNRPWLDGVLLIPQRAVDKPESLCLYSRKQPTLGVSTRMQEELKRAIEQERILAYEIPGLDSIMRSVQTSVAIKTVTLGEEGEAKETNSAVTAGIGYFLGILSYMLIMISGGMVMQGVIEEKSSRIVEVLLSSVTSFQLLMGKILGIATVFLLQLLIWLVLIGLLLPFAGLAMQALGGAETLASQQGMPTMDMGLGGLPSSAGELLGPLMNVNFVAIIGAFVVYFVFGYLLYAAAFAAVGSALEEGSADSTQMTLPITLPMLIAFLVMLKVAKSPDSALALWFSLIPFTSPVVMPVRVAYGVPFWQLGLSIGLPSAYSSAPSYC
ncbi:MAG: hypothetical protein CSA97_03245 [Bacteroidetes bacterium]|nr:MAG: hypothetical protein CSA97_03245 [Bacteroidota bacterium]